jgi:hypothetical protein
MADTKISALTAATVAAPANEFAINEAGTSKRLTAALLKEFCHSDWIRQAASRVLTSVGTEQKLFDSVANGTLTLTTGVYFFDAVVYITGLSATSGNTAFDILGAGSAVLGDVLYHAVGIDGAAGTAAAQTGSTAIQGQSPASIVTAGTATAVAFSLRGTFECTTAGTIIPSVTLVTAAAGTVAAGSFFRIQRVAAINAVSVGAWT